MSLRCGAKPPRAGVGECRARGRWTGREGGTAVRRECWEMDEGIICQRRPDPYLVHWPRWKWQERFARSMDHAPLASLRPVRSSPWNLLLGLRLLSCFLSHTRQPAWLVSSAGTCSPRGIDRYAFQRGVTNRIPDAAKRHPATRQGSGCRPRCRGPAKLKPSTPAPAPMAINHGIYPSHIVQGLHRQMDEDRIDMCSLREVHGLHTTRRTATALSLARSRTFSHT